MEAITEDVEGDDGKFSANFLHFLNQFSVVN